MAALSGSEVISRTNDWFTIDQQRERDPRSIAAVELLTLVECPGVGGDVVDHDRNLAIDRVADDADAFGTILLHREPGDANDIGAGTRARFRHHVRPWAIHDTDPGHHELPLLDSDVARLPEQLVTAVDPHNGRVDPAQDGMNTAEPRDLALLFLAFRDLAQKLLGMALQRRV